MQLLLFYTKNREGKRHVFNVGKIEKFPKLWKSDAKIQNYNRATVVTSFNPRYRSRWSVGNTVRRGSRKISLFKMFPLHLLASTRANKNQPSKTTRPVKIFRVKIHDGGRERVEKRREVEVGKGIWHVPWEGVIEEAYNEVRHEHEFFSFGGNLWKGNRQRAGRKSPAGTSSMIFLDNNSSMDLTCPYFYSIYRWRVTNENRALIYYTRDIFEESKTTKCYEYSIWCTNLFSSKIVVEWLFSFIPDIRSKICMYTQ